MTPQEFAVMCKYIEVAARAAYRVGREDERYGAPQKSDEFIIDAGKQLLIKKEMNKTNKNR